LALEAAGIPYLCFPQRGTVSAAALDLGFFMSRGKVFITGLDLGHRDIRAHARPYAFDRLWEEGASRLNPAYHRHFVRGGEITRGGSQGVYAAWFRQQLALWPRRLFSLGGNNPVFRDLEIREGDLEGACGEGGGRPVLREIPLGAPGDAPERAREVLRGALRDPRYGELLQTELGSARGAFNGLGVI
jgi:hypothetical protein